MCEVAKEIGAELIVIGLPLNMDGTEGERAIKSRKLAKTVEIWSGLPVRMWDERQTTCAAADLLDEKTVKTNLSGLSTYTYAPKFEKQIFAIENRTFKGYLRANGEAGIR